MSTKSDFNSMEKMKFGSTGNLTENRKSMSHLPSVVPATSSSSEPTSSSSDQSTQRRKVRWNLGVRVVLIPTRTEYKDIGLTDLIWWNENDYCIFRNGAAEELEIAVDYFQVDAKEAVKLLYQPEFDTRCKFLEQSPRLERLNNRGLQESSSFENTAGPKLSPVPNNSNNRTTNFIPSTATTNLMYPILVDDSCH